MPIPPRRGSETSSLGSKAPIGIENATETDTMSLTRDGLAEKVQKTWAAAAYFCSGALAINASQLLATPLSTFNPALYSSIMSHSKGTFSLLLTTMTQLWSPTTLHITGNASVRGLFFTDSSNNVMCELPARLVLIANHQIYTDWLYLWYIAYLARQHDAVYIILKESLRNIPVVGWGMVLNRFIFLKRDWAADEKTLKQAMARLREKKSNLKLSNSGSKNTKNGAGRGNARMDPMWLMLFPEGTNLASCTRLKSTAWAQKNLRGLRGSGDTRHVLLPRSKGLRLCLKELKGSVEDMYDCTIAYSGVPRGQYAQDIYPLPQSYLEGRAPRSVSMHWRRFPLGSIPGLGDDSHASQMSFESWLLARWREKDELIEYWYENDGKFPADKGVEVDNKSGKFKRGAGRIETTIRAAGWRDFLQVIAPIGVLASILLLFAGLLPVEVLAKIEKQVIGMDKQTHDGRRPEGVGRQSGKKLLAFNGSGYAPVGQGRGQPEGVRPKDARTPATNVGGPKPSPRVTSGRPAPIARSSGPYPSAAAGGRQKRMLGFANGSFKTLAHSSSKSIPGADTGSEEQSKESSKKQLASNARPKPVMASRPVSQTISGLPKKLPTGRLVKAPVDKKLNATTKK